MKHEILNNVAELNEILNDFFAKGFSRNSKPECQHLYQKKTFELACKVYKRGFLDTKNLEAKKQPIPLPKILNKEAFEAYFEELNLKENFFIVDENLFNKQEALQSLVKKFNHLKYMPNESTKSLDTVIYFINSIPENTKKLIALGGGITLDIAGFVAGLLNIEVYYLPSTLLASVDAGIGGKTGVNFFPYGKNQVGLFYEAKKLFCVPEYFLSLPFESVLCGLVEAIKHSWIFGEFINDKETILNIYNNNCTIDDYSFLVKKSILYKSYIVNQDPFESKDIRTALNLGHTLAHVIEALGESGSIHKLSHGIAVAHGLSFIFKSSLVIIPKEFSEIINLIYELTTKYPIKFYKHLSQNEVERYLIQDKKNETTDFCSLSLPRYGHFNLANSENSYLPVTKNFSIKQISTLMFEHINSFL